MFREPGWLQGLTALAASLFIPFAGATAAEYTIDPAHTVVSFEVRNLGIHSQRGTFKGANGTVALDAQTGNGRIDIVVDARSIESGSPAMENFLRGRSLLDVERYPEIAYKAAHVLFVNGEPERIEGELTLHGVTRSVYLTVTRYGYASRDASPVQRCIMAATATFRRSDFGMTRYRVLTSDEVKLAIQAEGVPSP